MFKINTTKGNFLYYFIIHGVKVIYNNHNSRLESIQTTLQRNDIILRETVVKQPTHSHKRLWVIISVKKRLIIYAIFLEVTQTLETACSMWKKFAALVNIGEKPHKLKMG